MKHQHHPTGRASGHVKLVERKRGAQWYVKYRTLDGHQVERKLGPAWPAMDAHRPATTPA